MTAETANSASRYNARDGACDIKLDAGNDRVMTFASSTLGLVHPARSMPTSAASVAGASAGGGEPGKTPFVAAVETNAEGHPLRVKLTVVEGSDSPKIAAWAQQHLNSGMEVLSDGLDPGSMACPQTGCVHEPMVTGGGKAAVERP